MNKNILIIAIALVSAGLWWKNSSSKQALPMVGVIQVIDNPALDQARKGIFDELEAQGFKDQQKISWRYESAQGNPGLAMQIAQKFIGQGAAVMVTIGTTVSQSALQVIQQSGSKTPLVFSCVTSPVAAKLVTSDKSPNKGISGVSDYVSAYKQFKYFKKIIPTLKRIGVVYNPGEANSVFLNDEMIKAGKDLGIEVILAAASRTSDVNTATQSLLGKVDALFVNHDNTALASFDCIVAAGKMQNIPIFVSDLDCLPQGALAALGADQYALGRQVGKIVADILKNPNKVFEKTMEYAEVVREEANEKVAAELKIVLPGNV